MTDTPRTDEQTGKNLLRDGSGWVTATFARTLECELATYQAELAWARKLLREAREEVVYVICVSPNAQHVMDSANLLRRIDAALKQEAGK